MSERRILRCQARNDMAGQCEFYKGHPGGHLSGMLIWGGKLVPHRMPTDAVATQAASTEVVEKGPGRREGEKL